MGISFKEKTSADVKKHKSIWVAEEFWKHHQDTIYSNGVFYLWGGQVYQKIDDIDFMILMSKRFPAFDEMAPSQQNTVMEVYRRSAKVPAEKFNCDDGLCLQNVYLSLADLKTFNHDKSRINTILIPYNYDAEAACPLWLTALDEILESDLNKIKTVQEFFGYSLTRQTEYAKALFLIGEGATGKSTVLDVLAMLVGRENVSVLSPRYYNNSMRVGAIENRLVLMSHEIPRGIEDYEAEFREIITGQTIEANPKHRKPYEFTPFCKVVWAMNEIPRINDHTSAFYRRVLPVEFNNKFEEEKQDRYLVNKLKNELPGILNWALAGLQRLRERGGFFQDAYMREHIAEIRLQNNPVAAWSAENIKANKETELIKADVYRNYLQWCGLNGHKNPLSNIKFSIELFRLFKTVTKKNVIKEINGVRCRIWPNLTWNTPGNDPQEQRLPEKQEEWPE